MLGSYKDLKTYLKETKLTGSRKGSPYTLEAHHLLEDEWMKSFGIDKSKGRCVALELGEHTFFSEHVPAALNRKKVVFRHIDIIFEAHAEVYIKNGHPEWVPEIRDFLRQNREIIKRRYQQGRVPGSKLSDFHKICQRVFKFLDAL